ncbi:hypothetical protein JCM11251_003192 [Rhodosporidiobolus azoricus]
MAPLSRPAILSLTALTLHFSVLSIVLHLSRTLPGRRYHASSAIFLTEAGKILVSFLLVLSTGELRPAVRERLKLRAMLRQQEEENREEERERERGERERREEEEWRREMSGNGGRGGGNGAAAGRRRSTEEKQGLLGAGGTEDGWTEATVVPMHRRTSSLTNSSASKEDSSSRTPLSPTSRTGPGSSLSINVPLANGNSTKPASAPSLALIPATPVPDPSPTRFPDQSALYPERPLDARFSSRYGEGESVLDDLGTGEWWRCLWAAVWGEGVWKLAVLAALFCFQGNAQYVASGNLSVPLFQLAYQLKIPATAMCSVILLNKALSRQQWASLFILTFGVGLVQLFSVTGGNTAEPPSPTPASGESSSSSSFDALSAHSEAPPNQMLGLAAVVAACMSSGFASVYFERILKVPSTTSSSSSSSASSSVSNSPDLSSPTLPSSIHQTQPSHPHPPLPDPDSILPSGKPSLWIRNIQLSIFGLAVGLPIVLWEIRGCLGALDYGYLDASADQGAAAAAAFATKQVREMVWWEKAHQVARAAGEGFFDGFNGITWVVIALQITGGLLSALVMQYADNLLKCFSTSLSILISVAASVVLFNFHITLGILSGSILVLGATFAYTSPSKDWRWRPSAHYSPLPQGLGTR